MKRKDNAKRLSALAEELRKQPKKFLPPKEAPPKKEAAPGKKKKVVKLESE